MSTLIEQVEASMKLCAALERRVAFLERVVGKEGRTETIERKPYPLPNNRAKRQRVTDKQGQEIRAAIMRELLAGPKKVAYLRRVTRCSMAGIYGYLSSLRAAGQVERGFAKGYWRRPEKIQAAA